MKYLVTRTVLVDAPSMLEAADDVRAGRGQEVAVDVESIAHVERELEMGNLRHALLWEGEA